MANSSIDLTQLKSRPLKSGDRELNDEELASVALDKIGDYQLRTGSPAPVDPKFVEWLREGASYVKEGKGSFVDYKKATVLKTLDYDMVLSNTRKANEKLEKSGAFDSKVMHIEKGEH